MPRPPRSFPDAPPVPAGGPALGPACSALLPDPAGPVVLLTQAPAVSAPGGFEILQQTI